MSCECPEQCPGATSCSCIFTYDDGICLCVCDFPMMLPASAREGGRKSSATKIDLCVRNVDLLSMALFLGHHCDGEFFVPAARSKETVSIGVKDISIADAAAKLGLIVGEPKAGPTGA
jgi:hypothetical protein